MPHGPTKPVEESTIDMRQRTLEWVVGFSVLFFGAPPTLEVRCNLLGD